MQHVVTTPRGIEGPVGLDSDPDHGETPHGEVKTRGVCVHEALREDPRLGESIHAEVGYAMRIQTYS